MSPKEKKNPVQIRVFIPQEAYDALKAESESIGTTISGITRMILLEHIKAKVEK